MTIMVPSARGAVRKNHSEVRPNFRSKLGPRASKNRPAHSRRRIQIQLQRKHPTRSFCEIDNFQSLNKKNLELWFMHFWNFSDVYKLCPKKAYSLVKFEEEVDSAIGVLVRENFSQLTYNF